jgi:hypothetical protein
MQETSCDRGRLADRPHLLSAFSTDSTSEFGVYDLGKKLLTDRGDRGQRISDHVYLLVCFDRIENYTEAVDRSFRAVKALAMQESAQKAADEMNRGREANLSALTFEMFFNPKIDEKLFVTAPLAFASIIKGYVNNYYDSLGTPTQRDKKEIMDILENGYGFGKGEARELLKKIYGYIPKALTITGFFNKIGNGEMIDERVFARDYGELIALQKEITERLARRLTENLNGLGVKMEEGNLGRLRRFLRLQSVS